MLTSSSSKDDGVKVHVLTGDLFMSDAQTLVNTVNCVGVMGKGVALEFKKRFPDMYADYVSRCAKGQVRLGEPYLFRRLFPPWILNFPTKDHWRSVSRLADIERGLDYLEEHYREWGITSLAVPPLGCGQGQLEWRVVGPTLYRHLTRLDVPVHLYAPYQTPQEELEESFLARTEGHLSVVASAYPTSRIDPAWVALVEIVARVTRETYHWPVGRTTLQKIAYFATAAGLPTGLHFARSSYGPFSANLKPLITMLVNNGLLHEQQLGRMFSVTPGRTFPDAAAEFRAELARWEAVIERVTDLFLRIRTQQAEVAATVFFAARSLAEEGKAKPSEVQVLDEVRRWKQRRRPPLHDEEIAGTIRNLNLLRWLDVQPSQDLPLPKEVLSSFE